MVPWLHNILTWLDVLKYPAAFHYTLMFPGQLQSLLAFSVLLINEFMNEKKNQKKTMPLASKRVLCLSFLSMIFLFLVLAKLTGRELVKKNRPHWEDDGKTVLISLSSCLKSCVHGVSSWSIWVLRIPIISIKWFSILLRIRILIRENGYNSLHSLLFTPFGRWHWTF